MICVIAKLPPDAVERLSILKEAAVSKKPLMHSIYGHITIATYLPDDDAEFLQACSGIIRETPSFSVRYEKLEVLPETSIVVATPSKSTVLLDLHNRIAEKYSGSLDRWTCGNEWYPHTTLLYDPGADLNDLCRNMQQHFSPFEAWITQVEFSKVEETGYTILETIDLKPSLSIDDDISR